jgi:predicted aspartyl protease
MKKHLQYVTGTMLSLLFASSSTTATEFSTSIPMENKGASTFYVTTEIAGLDTVDFMVDTGSGYATINEETLAMLTQEQSAIYVKDLEGILADGSRLVVPVYRVKSMNIGGNCMLENIEVAVFPGNTRQILGLSALRQAAPFIFSMNPPQLVLSHCSTGIAKTQTKPKPVVEVLEKTAKPTSVSPS